jgi:sporulation protein YlmC with PRC-barrel domain
MATATMKGTSQKMFSARRFIGKDVFDVKSQHVGEVEDIILDVDTACAKWTVLSAGGVLGFGGRDYIVPIQTISIDQGSGHLMLSFEEGRLRNAPTYDRDNPPDWGDQQWMQSLYAYYGMSQGPMGGQAGQGGQQGWEQGWQQGYREGSGQTYQQTYQTGQGSYQGTERRHEMRTYEGADRRHGEQQRANQPLGSRQSMGGGTGQAYGQTQQGGTQGSTTGQPYSGQRGTYQQGGSGEMGQSSESENRQPGDPDWTKRT